MATISVEDLEVELFTWIGTVFAQPQGDGWRFHAVALPQTNLGSDPCRHLVVSVVQRWLAGDRRGWYARADGWYATELFSWPCPDIDALPSAVEGWLAAKRAVS